MVPDNFRDLFVAIGTCAATLIGLLFVAMSITQNREVTDSEEVREFRAAASLLAFTNAFTVSLFGLVPTTNIGLPAAVVGAAGVLFTAGGVRTILGLHLAGRQGRSQIWLLIALLVVFGVQVFWGIRLAINPHHLYALEYVADALIASLLIGIGRTWEFVGQWDTGVISSLVRLVGRPGRGREAGDGGRSTPSGPAGS